MSEQKPACLHTQEEEQYICLNTQCVDYSQLKLDCLACLQKSHPHYECIFHVNQILADAKNNQHTIYNMIEQNQTQMQDLLSKWDVETNLIKQTFNDWIDQFKKDATAEIKKYETNLKEHSDLLLKPLFSKDNLSFIVRLRAYDHQSYRSWDAISKLDNNLRELSYQFENFFKQLKELCKLDSFQNLPKLGEIYSYPSTPEYELCSEVGCANIEKTKFCLEQNCLRNSNSTLECPSCLANRHCIRNCYKEHRDFFLNGMDVWSRQNQYINNIRCFCDSKTGEVEMLIKRFNELLANYAKSTDLKLIQFQQFMLQKQQSIVKNLQQFKSKFQTEKFVIYKEIHQERDYSKLAGITQMDQELKKLANNFKAKFEEMNSRNFQDLWIEENGNFEITQIQSGDFKF